MYEKYKDKKVNGSITPISSVFYKNLNSNSFITDTPKVSFKIMDELGTEIGHYLLDNIVSFELDNERIIIYSSDKVFITYEFISITDAEIANNKLNNLINGIPN
jgi:hypothetical protein